MKKTTTQKEKQIVPMKDSYEITSPTQMTAMASVLKSHIVNHKLYTNISGKNYVQVEGWQFAGGLLGLFPIVSLVEDLSKVGEVKWRAVVEIINIRTGATIGRGFAICSNKENKKKTFDEYAILSMAQTRAIGKAYRNMIGWVMKLAGYETTPSEEMSRIGDPSVVQANKSIVTQAIKRGQVMGPDGLPTYVCTHCGQPITDQEYTYSMNLYKKPLCREGQREIKTKK